MTKDISVVNDLKNLNDASLADVRSKIDEMDKQILQLIESRLALASQVVAAKGGRAIFRPGREADVLRGLIASSSLAPQMIEKIWRQIMMSTLNQQAQLRIATLDSAAIHQVIYSRFSAAVMISSFTSGDEMLDAVGGGQVDLGIFPHWRRDPSWLQHLRSYRRQGRNVFISGFTSFFRVGVEEAGVIVTPYRPDASSADVTLIDQGGEIVEIKGHHPDRMGFLGIIQEPFSA